jgi:hypothetical protein
MLGELAASGFSIGALAHWGEAYLYEVNPLWTMRPLKPVADSAASFVAMPFPILLPSTSSCESDSPWRCLTWQVQKMIKSRSTFYKTFGWDKVKTVRHLIWTLTNASASRPACTILSSFAVPSDFP